MKALVVYDSVYGNTEKIAQAIGAAQSPHGDVKVMRAGDATPEHLAGLDVVVVGSPTHGGRPTSTIRAWLKALPRDSLKGVKTAGTELSRKVKG